MRKQETTSTFEICIGKTSEGDDVVLDAFSLISSRVLVCCNSGGGKSYLLRKIVELVASRVPTLIIDPDGEFATLREMIDLVLVGPDGEVPAATATASKLARRLVELRVNAVMDLSMLGLEDKQLFVKLFLESLLTLPRNLWSHTFVVIDEAHKFASTEQSNVVSTRAVVALMDQGRKRRLGGILATQRLSKLVASARAEANNVFIGKTAQDLDLKRAVDLLGLEKRDWQAIKRSKPGDFYAFGPAFVRQDGVVRFHVDAVKTTHEDDKRGLRSHTPKPSSDILRVLPELSDLQQEVEQEQSEVTRLRGEVARLRELGRQTERGGASREEVEAARSTGERAGHEEGVRVGFEHGWIAARDTLVRSFREAVESLGEAIAEASNAIARTPPKTLSSSVSKPPAPRRSTQTKSAPRAPQAVPSNEVKPPSSSDGEIGRGAPYKIICVLVQHRERMSRTKAAFLAGIRPTTGTFRNALSTLRQEGLMLDHADGQIEATPQARARFHTVDPLPTGPAILDFWRRKFGEGAPGKLFSVLADARRPLSRDEAAARAGIKPTTGTFRNALSTLRIAGVMQDEPDGQIRLSSELR